MKEPDCATCWKKETCEKAQDGCFCPGYQSKQPPERSEMASVWRQGEAEGHNCI